MRVSLALVGGEVVPEVGVDGSGAEEEVEVYFSPDLEGEGKKVDWLGSCWPYQGYFGFV